MQCSLDPCPTWYCRRAQLEHAPVTAVTQTGATVGCPIQISRRIHNQFPGRKSTVASTLKGVDDRLGQVSGVTAAHEKQRDKKKSKCSGIPSLHLSDPLAAPLPVGILTQTDPKNCFGRSKKASIPDRVFRHTARTFQSLWGIGSKAGRLCLEKCGRYCPLGRSALAIFIRLCSA